MSITLLHGDCREQLQTLPDRSVQCVVTSPPYYNLRKYSDDPREIGQEATPSLYVAALVEVFRQVRRVLRDDGVCWINLGDSYSSGGMSNPSTKSTLGGGKDRGAADYSIVRKAPTGLADKQLLGIPWRVAFALQDDGWYLRSDIIWSKPNCMPESVTDRPTRAHEYVFLLAKSARYFYDAAVIAEPVAEQRPITTWVERKAAGEPMRRGDPGESGHVTRTATLSSNPTRNKRTVWTISTQSYSGAHYATMPEALIEPCILAGSSAQACEHCGAAWVRVTEDPYKGQKGSLASGEVGEANSVGSLRDENGIIHWGDNHPSKSAKWWTTRETTGFSPSCACPDNTGSTASVVLDPFAGSGTVGRVALRLQRRAVLIELSATYIDEHIEKRTNGVQVEMQL